VYIKPAIAIAQYNTVKNRSTLSVLLLFIVYKFRLLIVTIKTLVGKLILIILLLYIILMLLPTGGHSIPISSPGV